MVDGRAGVADRGAAAVEFALVSLLLFTILFGILQYGMGFFEQQAASSTARDAARLAAVGISDCGVFSSTVRADAAANGLRMGAGTTVHARFTPSGANQPIGDVVVTLTYTPTRIGLSWIPYPSGDSHGNLTVTARAHVEQLGSVRDTC